LRDAVSHRPDANTAAWLAWQNPQDTVGTGSEWGAWLELGLSRDDVKAAVDAGLRAEHVIMVAHETHRPISTVARNVVAWAKADCFPTVRQMKILTRCGVEYLDPSRTAVDALVGDVDKGRLLSTTVNSTAHRTELAIMLMVLGTRRAVLHALANGIHSVDDLDSTFH
jgi:hypothetical protein